MSVPLMRQLGKSTTMEWDMKSTWTKEQAQDFRDWHDRRLAELNYPAETVSELTNAREKWMPPIVSHDTWIDELSEIERLKAESEMLKKDAERGRWLIENLGQLVVHAELIYSERDKLHHSYVTSIRINHTFAPFVNDSTVAAIDAAMKKDDSHGH